MAEEKEKPEITYVKSYNKNEKVGAVVFLNLYKRDPSDNDGYAMMSLTLYADKEESLPERLEAALIKFNEKGWVEFRPAPKDVQRYEELPKPENPPESNDEDGELIYEDIPEEKPVDHYYIVEGISHATTKNGKDCLRVWNSNAWFKTYGLVAMDWNLPPSIKEEYKSWPLNKVYKPPKEMYAVVTRKKGEYENVIGFLTEEQYKNNL